MLVICVILLIIGAIFDIELIKVGALIIAVVSVLAVPFAYSIRIHNENIQRIKLAQTLIDAGAEVYMDGQLVDPNKIVIDEYEITIRDGFIILH